ncbi:MAG: sialate O-acetylesterase [Clostridia bacterium]|nr:sialate O-acetylesterase [Clostridia bacterium]
MAQTKLAGILCDGMVIQRNEEFHIWGTEDTLKTVKVIFEGKEYEAEVIDNKFDAVLPPHSEGTGFEIEVYGSERIILKDILFGDVFLCAGQSNMELYAYRVMDISEEEILNTNIPTLRQYYLAPNYRLDESKEAELFDGKWIKAVPGEIKMMSALALFCGKNIQSKVNVPIGLVAVAQGGSTIESWMSRKSLEEFGDYTELMDKFMEDGSLQKFLKDKDSKINKWREELKDEGFENRAKRIPDSAFEVNLPGMFLKSEGNGFTGSMWLYKKINIESTDEDAFLYLGELMDSDRTYINGEFVGCTEYSYPPRKYPFDGKILKEGENLIAVRLLVDHENGGFLLEHPYYLRVGNKKYELSGTWYKAYENKADQECEVVVMGQTIPTALYTASIRPIRNLKLKGILWYQGESNSEDPYNKKHGAPEGKGYDLMFKRMIELWRETFKQELPVVCVEMPDYINPVTGDDENWHVIQRMQREAPAMVDKCKVALGRDLGQPYELHPQLKSELGKRIAKEALELMY